MTSNYSYGRESSRLLDKLNPGQLKAATTESSALVWAGPGTGKTQVTASRAGWLIETGRCKPHELLVVTFTNRAVREFRDRLETLLGTSAAQVRVSTFHSLALSLVEIQQQLGERERFRLLNSETRFKLLEELIIDALKRQPQSLSLKEAEGEPANFKRLVEQVGHLISSLKTRQEEESPNAISIGNKLDIYFEDYLVDEPVHKLIQQIWPRYRQHLTARGFLDLDDLIPQATITLKKWPALVRLPGVGVQQVLLDETQDTSPGQLELLLTLMQTSGEQHSPSQNQNQPELIAVGDSRQQIFSYLHSGPYQRLAKFLPATASMSLDIQYRFGPTINRTASALSWRLGCDLAVRPARLLDDPDQKFSALFAGEKVPRGQLPLTIYEAEDEEEEAGFVAQEILRVREHRPKVQIAVLVRTRAQGEQVGRFLAKLSISHRVLTGADSKIAEANSAGNNPRLTPVCSSGLKPQEPTPTPVTISTIHASKGAEFEVVFVPGLAQGLFPVSQNRLLEDLRLFFVAITRSRYLVYLSYPGHVKRPRSLNRYDTKPAGMGNETGRAEKAAPSIFLSILP